MIPDGELLALIPARAGSKRLAGKNLSMLAGKPLIVWTINSAKQSKYIDRIVVTTESEEIANVAKDAGAEVPFIRPKNLASDQASSIDVVVHALTEFKKAGQTYKYLILLQPTSPLRNAEHIDESVELLIAKGADAVIGVTEVEHLNEWSNSLPTTFSMDRFFGRQTEKRSQDLTTKYRVNGGIYLIQTSSVMKYRTFFLEKNIFAYKMDKAVSVDIDTLFDFEFAEFLISGKSSEKVRAGH